MDWAVTLREYPGGYSGTRYPVATGVGTNARDQVVTWQGNWALTVVNNTGQEIPGGWAITTYINYDYGTHAANAYWSEGSGLQNNLPALGDGQSMEIDLDALMGTKPLYRGSSGGTAPPLLQIPASGTADASTTFQYKVVATIPGQGTIEELFTVNVTGNVGSIAAASEYANVLPSNNDTFYLGGNNPDDVVDATFNLQLTDYNENGGTVTLWVGGVEKFSQAIPGGSAQGVETNFSVTLDSVNGDLHGEIYEWKADGEVIASGTTPDYAPAGEFMLGNPFEVNDAAVRPEAPEFYPEPDDEEPDGWTPPPGAGDDGNPNDEDMTKADFYDAMRRAVRDGLRDGLGGVGGGQVGIGGVSQMAEGANDGNGKDGVQETADGALALLDGIGDTPGELLDLMSAPAFPTAQNKVYQFGGVLPIFGPVNLDLTPWQSTIEACRAAALVLMAFFALERSIVMVRMSTVDSAGK